MFCSDEPESFFDDLKSLDNSYDRNFVGDGSDRVVVFFDQSYGLYDAYERPLQLTREDVIPFAIVPRADLSAREPAGEVGLPTVLCAVVDMCRDRDAAYTRWECECQEAYDVKPPEPVQPHITVVVQNADRSLMAEQGKISAGILSLLQQIARLGPSAKASVVLQTNTSFELCQELMPHFEYITHDLPGPEERQQLLSQKLCLGPDQVTDQIIRSAAGLPRAKILQYASEVLVEKGHLSASAFFYKKAKYLSRASKLEVWSPEFITNMLLRPTLDSLRDTSVGPKEDLAASAETRLLSEEPVADTPCKNYVVQYMTDQGVQKLSSVMLPSTFETAFAPERDYYSFRSIVGLDALKSFLGSAFRPNVPDRAKLKHVLMLGVPGVGKSFMMQCCSGEFGVPLSKISAAQLYSKWLGETEKILDNSLKTAESIGGILAIDEFQRFLPTGNSENGVENRLLGSLLTWFNDQNSNLVLSAANDISNLPDEITRSGRVDALIFVGFPSPESRAKTWQMYQDRYKIASQERPSDAYWTPSDIMSCCRLAEMQSVSLVEASKWVTPSYSKNKEQLDTLMRWAEKAGCICAETGDRFTADNVKKIVEKSTPRAASRQRRL